MSAPLRLGTRRSSLALAQSRLVAEAITSSTGRDVSLVEVSTLGDASSEALSMLGGTGVFVGALRDALIEGRVDLAVHSLKDLPTSLGKGVRLAAVPRRDDPRDVLVTRDGRGLADLAPGAQVGTGAPRRAAQLRALGLGLRVVPIRGNVDTRLRKLADGEVDAVVLARAGLARLGRLEAVAEVLDPMQMLPAPGQGALAVECRDDAADLAEALAGLDDWSSRCAVTAERAVLQTLKVGCSAPVGALAETAEGEHGSEIYLRAVVAAQDGSYAVRRSTTGSPQKAEPLGRELAQALLADGAAALISPPGVLMDEERTVQ